MLLLISDNNERAAAKSISAARRHGLRVAAAAHGWKGDGMAGTDAGRLQTLERGLMALRTLGEARDGLRIAELAERLGIHRTIAYRIVNTLVAHNMVHRLADGRLVLGSGAATLGAQAEGNLRALSRPVIEALADAAAATAFLCLAEGEEGVAILTAEPRNLLLNIHYRVGSRHPLNRGAAGLAILAGRPPAAHDSEPVARARRQGYSVTRGELHVGAVGVASPVRLPPDAFRGLECSVGVVAMHGLDEAAAAAIVIASAEALGAVLGPAAGEVQTRA